MTKTLFATAALLLVTAAPAFADEKPVEMSFQRDGDIYVYTKAELPDRVVLAGRRLPAGDSFELTVRGAQVTGTVGDRSVSFKMPRARTRAGSTAVVAAR
ncbi:hypothetical protein U1839_09030 [Sphingomonas sp. RT2P30]|uniref:hypothetical protein n=1 Tax=Parasphingomonas halimpatiens TaxID=3096162 RepID=UPI002FC636CE